MVDVCEEYERYLKQYKAFLRTYARRQRARVQPVVTRKRQGIGLRLLVWFGRLLNWVAYGMVRAIERVTDAVVAALIR